MENVSINHLAVIVAALSDLLVGALWYSPLLFVKAWKRETGLTDEKLKQGSMILTFGLAFVFSLVITYNLAFFLGSGDMKLGDYLMYSFLAGFGWVAMALGIISLFEKKSWKYILISWGYIVVAFVLKGLILGLWR